MDTSMSGTDSSFLDMSFDQGYNIVERQHIDRLSSGEQVMTRNESITSLTDEIDDDEDSSAKTYKDRRRNAHTAAEQKRRDSIKKGYEDLQRIVPTCQQMDSMGSQKLSKATILQRSIEYIQHLIKQKKKKEEELSALRKEVMALKIMKANYEQIVKAHQNTPVPGQSQVSDQLKFAVFKSVMDSQFQSFNASISVGSFAELSACVFSWLEEYCKPQTLQEVVQGVLRQHLSNLPSGSNMTNMGASSSSGNY